MNLKVKKILLLIVAISLFSSCSQQNLTISKMNSAPYSKYSKSVEWVAGDIEKIDSFKELDTKNILKNEELLSNNQKTKVKKSAESKLVFQNNSIKEKPNKKANSIDTKSIFIPKSPILALKSNLKNVDKNKQLDKNLKAAIIFALIALIFSALARIEIFAIFAVVFWVLALVMLILWVLSL
jgi:hypothetical protein